VPLKAKQGGGVEQGLEFLSTEGKNPQATITHASPSFSFFGFELRKVLHPSTLNNLLPWFPAISGRDSTSPKLPGCYTHRTHYYACQTA
jgi:hypothetical protein